MNELIDDIYADLLIELDVVDGTKDAVLLKVKIKNAVDEVVSKMKFPGNFTDEAILKETKQNKSVIHNVAVYDFCQVGSEFLKAHQESNVQMTYTDRNSLFTFIPYANIL